MRATALGFSVLLVSVFHACMPDPSMLARPMHPCPFARWWPLVSLDASSPRLVQYSEAFSSIYSTVVKWAKKSKHARPCWRLMVRMTCGGSVEFYMEKKREPILPLLLKVRGAHPREVLH